MENFRFNCVINDFIAVYGVGYSLKIKLLTTLPLVFSSSNQSVAGQISVSLFS